MNISQFDENGIDIPIDTSAFGNVTVRSLNRTGLVVEAIDVEVDVSPGLPCFIIVGLPDAAVAEARDRVRSAIKNSGFSFPRHRVTVNLAPSHIRKSGSHFDLPIAVGILIASNQIASITVEESRTFIVGELSLNGDIRAVRGALPLMHYAFTDHNAHTLIVPAANGRELAPHSDDKTILLADSLCSIALGTNDTSDSPTENKQLPKLIHGTIQSSVEYPTLFEDIVGQEHAKRAMMIAAAGNHNILLHGSPGAGKSMLAQALQSILPAMNASEILETEMIHSIVGSKSSQHGVRPYRAPHHTASTVAIIGGGTHLHPGELSLAHNGILFLDELPEYKREVIESLRQPLENGTIAISRARGRADYPARCILVAAMNPCPCGFADYGSSAMSANGQNAKARQECTCSPYSIQQYQQKLSGPLLDRIDIKVQMTAVPPEKLQQTANRSGVRQSTRVERSKTIQRRVNAAYTKQIKRQGCANAYLPAKQARKTIELSPSSSTLLAQALQQRKLSTRGYTKTLRIARTIADLEQRSAVCDGDVAEALSYTV